MDNAYEPEIIRLPFPTDFQDESDEDVLSRASAMCGAAELIFQHAMQSGQTITITPDDRQEARTIFDTPALTTTIQTTAVGIHLAALLTEYDITVVQSAHQLRNFCTNILIDKAVNGRSEQVQLRAVEMIGKIKDVALFEERSTILVAQMPTDKIKDALRDKINNMRARVTNATTIEATS